MKHFCRLFPLFFFFSFSVKLESQSVTKSDSLQVLILTKKLKRLKGTERVDCFNELSREYLYSVTIDRAKAQHLGFHFAKQAEKLATELNYKAGLARAYLNLGKRLLNLTNSDIFWHKALKIAETNHFSAIAGWAWLGIGDNEMDKTSDHSATPLIYWKKALSYFEKVKDFDGLTEANLSIAKEYLSMGTYEEAFRYCQKSLAAANHQITRTVSYRYWLLQDALWTMSKIYESVGDYRNAMNHLMQAKKYGSKYELWWKMEEQIGLLYAKMNKHDSALHYLNKYMENKNALYNNVSLAEYFISQDKFTDALESLGRARQTITRLYGTERFSNFSRVQLAYGLAFRGLKNYDSALIYLKNSLRIYDKETQLKAMEAVAETYAALKIYDSAFTQLQRYKALNDSVSNRQFIWRLNNQLYQSERAAIEFIRANQIVLLKKDNSLKEELLKTEEILRRQKESENLLLVQESKIRKQELEKEKIQKKQKESEFLVLNQNLKLKQQQLKQKSQLQNFLIIGFILLGLSGFFIVRSLHLKRKNEMMARQIAETKFELGNLEKKRQEAGFRQQAIELEMQALRAQMNPHFIFNCLSSINRYIIKNQTEDASDYLTRFSRLIRMVLINSQKSVITLEDELVMLRLYLDMERLRFKNSFDYNITFTNTIEPATIFVPPLLLQPFCENAIWHGLMHKDGPGKLEVTLNFKSEMLTCTISDNGVGRAKAAAYKNQTAEKQKSLGLQITKERLALFNKQKQDEVCFEMKDVINENGFVEGTQVDLHIRHKPLVEEEIF
jgi:hypothetical protein